MGRHICSIKQLGLLPDLLNPHTLTVCNDTVCILDQKDEKIVHMFDALTGKPLGTSSSSGKSLKHHTGLLTIALDHRGPPVTRQLILLDKNHDLYITPVRSFGSTSKMTSIVGEDGQVKVWSRSLMLRSTLVQSSSPVYSVSWSPDSSQLLYTSGKHLIIQSLQPSSKPLQWKAHDGLILAVDWSLLGNLIISGGEDRKYKWSYSLDKPDSGTLFSLSWTMDSTQLAAGCADGRVIFAHVVDRQLEWKNWCATVNADHTIDMVDISNESAEHLEFPERVVRASLGWGHLLVTTPTQCYIYNSRSWNTPVTMDLKGGLVILIQQTERHFLLVDSVSGLQLISYEGHHICSIKQLGLLPDSLNPHTVTVCNDTVCILDQKDEKIVHMFDALTGKPLGTSSSSGKSLKHHTELLTIALDHHGPPATRQLILLDKNHDLYITPVRSFGSTSKMTSIGSMVASVAWNDQSNILAGMQDGRFTVWYHPTVVYTDKDLLTGTISRRGGNEFVKNPQIVHFLGNQCTLRRTDGALITTSISPFPGLLHEYANSSKWNEAIRLCRFVKDEALWACLAGMACASRDLATAEIAYAAINEVDKVYHLRKIKELSGQERRNAELALFCRQPLQAEAIYIQAGMIFRAIELNMTLFNWERALELAIKHKTHVDTVLAFRHRYLEEIGWKENLTKFQQYSEKISLDWEKINAKIAMEAEKESEKT
ncbi:intraflagellar transport protein 80 homolog isoform X3 [Dysidea avara]|uniref:intraflagellar transport protein 80 homolog isoform X3 n=1 Tax=Dysidea avara TaxID=196820 RepID=UPI00332B4DF3